MDKSEPWIPASLFNQILNDSGWEVQHIEDVVSPSTIHLEVKTTSDGHLEWEFKYQLQPIKCNNVTYTRKGFGLSLIHI